MPCEVRQGEIGGDSAIGLYIPVFRQTDPSITITFKGIIETSVITGSSFDGDTALLYDSSPFIISNNSGRAYSTSASNWKSLPIITIFANYTLQETLHSTLLVETPDLYVNIGESATFITTFTLSEGTTEVVVLDHVMFGNMKIIDSSVHFGANVNSSIMLQGDSGLIKDSYHITFDFGTIVNNPDNVENLDDVVTVLVTVVVEDTTENSNGTALVSEAMLTFGSLTTVPYVSSNVSIYVLEPDLEIRQLATPLYGDAGDVVTFKLNIQHSERSSSVAYDIYISQEMSSYMDVINGSVECSVNCSVLSTGSTLTVYVDQLLLDSQAIEITFDAVITSEVVTGSSFSIDSRLDYDSSNADVDGNTGRFYETLASVSAPLAAFHVYANYTVEHKLAATSISQTPGHFVNIGETATFVTIFSLSEGTSLDTIVNYTLPGQLQAIRSYVIFGSNMRSGSMGPESNGTILQGGSLVVFDLGSVVNDPDNIVSDGDKIWCFVEVLVENDVSLVNNTKLTDNSWFSFGSIDALRTSTVSITVIEPYLGVHSAASPLSGDAGDVVHHTITVYHSHPYSSIAFGLFVSCQLHPFLHPVNNSVAASVPHEVVSGDSSGDLDFAIYIPLMDRFDEPIAIEFDAVVSPSVILGSTFSSDVSVFYLSSPVEGRDYEHMASENQVLPVFVMDKRYNVSQSLFSTSLDLTENDQVNIGESATFVTSFVLSEGTANSVVFRDTAPSKMKIIASYVVFGRNIISSTAHSGKNGTLTGDYEIALDLGNVTTMPDNIWASVEDHIDVYVQCVVENDTSNRNGSKLYNNGLLTFNNIDGGVSLIVNASVTVVEPLLEVTTKAWPLAAQAGDIINWNVTIVHRVGSTGPAFGLNFVHNLFPYVAPEGHLSVDGPSGVRVVSGTQPEDSTVTIIIPHFALKDTKGQITIAFKTVVKYIVLTGSFFTLDAQLTYLSTDLPLVPNTVRSYETLASDYNHKLPAIVVFDVYGFSLTLAESSIAETPGTYSEKL